GFRRGCRRGGFRRGGFRRGGFRRAPAEQRGRGGGEDQHRQQPGAHQRGRRQRGDLPERDTDLRGGHDERQRGGLEQPQGQRAPGAVGAQADERGQPAHHQQRQQEHRDP